MVTIKDGSLALLNLFGALGSSIQNGLVGHAQYYGLSPALSAKGKAKNQGSSNSLWFGAPVGRTPQNPGSTFTGMWDQEGAALEVAPATQTTVTIAATKTARIIQWSNPGSAIRTLSAGQNTYPRYASWKGYWHAHGTMTFFIQPFLVLMENGQSVASTDGTGNEVSSQIASSLGAEDYSLVLGPIVPGKPFMDNGTKRWVADVTMDLRKFAEAYSLYNEKKEQDSEDPAELLIGIAVYGAPQSVTVDGYEMRSYVLQKRSLLGA